MNTIILALSIFTTTFPPVCIGTCPETPLTVCPSACPALIPTGEFVGWNSSGTTWSSTQCCSQGGPYCWGTRFSPGDAIQWTANFPYDPANDGIYIVTSEPVFITSVDPLYSFRRWYMNVLPPVPTAEKWSGCCGEFGTLVKLYSTVLFRDGFESGNFSNWDNVVGAEPSSETADKSGEK